MTVSLQQIMDVLEIAYPAIYAEEWDQVGLHFGDKNSKVKKLMTALDIRPEVVDEAINKQVDTIIVHHPVLFSPISRMDNSTSELRMYSQLVKHDINVFVLHTNLDRAWDGMNDWLAQSLDLQHVISLEAIKDNEIPGLGRFGYLREPLKRDELITYVKEKLRVPYLKIIEQEAKSSYESIAITGGSAFDSIEDAVALDADVFITGDISYHKGHEALEHKLLTMDAGHFIEHVFIRKMADYLNEINLRNHWQLEIIESESNTNPFEYK